MIDYKFLMIRTNNLFNSVSDIEQTVNEFSKNGWEFRSFQYFEEVMSVLLIFEREV